MRTLDEDTRVFPFSFSSSPFGQTAASGNYTFISDPGELCLLLDLHESLALLAKSRVL